MKFLKVLDKIFTALSFIIAGFLNLISLFTIIALALSIFSKEQSTIKDVLETLFFLIFFIFIYFITERKINKRIEKVEED